MILLVTSNLIIQGVPRLDINTSEGESAPYLACKYEAEKRGSFNIPWLKRKLLSWLSFGVNL